MEPWYKIATPRREVREGRSFNPDEFAIALEQVETLVPRGLALASEGALSRRSVWERARAYRSKLERFTHQQLGS